MMQYFALAVLAIIIGVFVHRAISRGQLRVASRLDAVLEAGDASVALVVARAIVPWGFVGTWWWYLVLAAFGVGLAGLVLRWPALPTIRPARRTTRVVLAVTHILVLVAILALVL